MFLRLLLLSALVTSADGFAPPAMMDLNATVGPLSVLASPIPMRKTPKDQLGTSSHKHRQVLRVPRDFGAPGRDIVVDAWIPKGGNPELTEVRMWWLESNEDNLRKPFGKKTKKKVTVTYDQRAADDWRVSFGAGGRKFTFQVTLDEEGEPVVYGNVKVGRKTVEHCKVDKASLYAKKLLDVTIGLDRLAISCTDDQGKRHRGNLRRTR
jgi:hypothetical protein